MMSGAALVAMIVMMVLMCGAMMTGAVFAIRAWRRTPRNGADPAPRLDDRHSPRDSH